MTRSKDIGTQTETAVVRYLQVNGWPHAERRALRGVLDAGDITGTPGVAWSVKGGAVAAVATDGDIEKWMGELAAIRRNAGAAIGVLVCKRKGAGAASVGRWPAWLTLRDLAHLTVGLSGSYPLHHADTVVRVLFADLMPLLHTAGYGTAP